MVVEEVIIGNTQLGEELQVSVYEEKSGRCAPVQTRTELAEEPRIK